MAASIASAALVHREHESRLSDMVAATPYPDWVMVVSKTAALCLVITVLLLLATLTAIGIQAASGYRRFEPALYLQGVFIYGGAYFYFLAVVGVFSFEVAETKVAQVMDFSRRHQHPLQCTMEKE